MKRRAIAALAAFVSAATVAILAPAAPAYAQDGRHCQTFYAQGDPASGWGFTICVKLEHDTVWHAFRATASISTRTPGIRGMLISVVYQIDNDATPESAANRGQPPQVSAQTNWDLCEGVHTFNVYAGGSVTWPNGVTSSFVGPVYTVPRTLSGSC